MRRRRALGAVTFLIVATISAWPRWSSATRGLQMVRRCGEEEDVVAVTGAATPNPAAPGGVEVTEPAITLLGEPAQPPPVDLWRPAIDAGLPAILDHAAVTWRHPGPPGALEVATTSLRGFRAALDQLGFTEIQTPKLVSSATESGATVFGVDYFGRPAAWPSPRSSTSRRWSACSSASTRPARCSAPNRTTPPATSAEIHARRRAPVPSATTRDVLAVLTHALAGMTAAVRDEQREGPLNC